jgi:hypothetical protein
MFAEVTLILFAFFSVPVLVGMVIEAHRRGMLCFPLRDTLWAMVVVAMGLAWWADRRELYEHKSALWRAVHRFAEAWPGEEFPESVYQEIPWLRDWYGNRWPR